MKTIALYSHTHYTAASGVLNCSYLYHSTSIHSWTINIVVVVGGGTHFNHFPAALAKTILLVSIQKLRLFGITHRLEVVYEEQADVTNKSVFIEF